MRDVASSHPNTWAISTSSYFQISKLPWLIIQFHMSLKLKGRN